MWLETVALACADSFRASAQRFIDPKRIRSDLPEGHISNFDDKFGDLAVCATNLALALEIYLKVLRSQHGLPGRTGRSGHDLWELYNDLPESVRKEIEERYDAGRTTPSPTYASISFALTRNPNYSFKDLDNVSMRLEDVLKRSKDVFIAWRYVFEVPEAENAGDRLHTFEYLLLLFASYAIEAVISKNWFTPKLGDDPTAPRAWLLLSDADFSKVSSPDQQSTVVITDRYTGKRYRVRTLDSESVAELI